MCAERRRVTPIFTNQKRGVNENFHFSPTLLIPFTGHSLPFFLQLPTAIHMARNGALHKEDHEQKSAANQK